MCLPGCALQSSLICSSCLQAGEYLEAMLASSTPGCVFEAAQALLQLARLQSAAPNSGCYNAVSGAAASWAAVAVAALLQLWDRQLSTAGHAQIMDVLCQHLDCLQVGTGSASWLLSALQGLRRLSTHAASTWTASRSELWSGMGNFNSSAALTLQVCSPSAHLPPGSSSPLHCCPLQVTAQLGLMRQLFPLIATLPSAAGRTSALAHAWRVAVTLDLATRRAIRSGDRAVPGAQLKDMLTDSFVMDIVSGDVSGAPQLRSKSFVPGRCWC